MTLIEYAPTEDEILDFINDGIRQLQDSQTEPKYILVGIDAYRTLRKAVGQRFKRGAGTFETYQYFPIIVDPLRKDTVCVLPAPDVCAREAQIHRI